MPVIRIKSEIERVGFGVYAAQMLSTAYTKDGVLEYTLATGQTDIAIPISFSTGITTVLAFFITSDQTISWRLAAADTAITLSANGFILVSATSITNLLISNASGSTANIKILVAGNT